MLIDAPYKNGDVVTLKLGSGEELVGRLEEETNDNIKLKTPLTLVMAQQGVGLQQYMFTADPNKAYNFSRSGVVVITKTVKEFAEAYQQQTSGIVTAPAGMGNAVKSK